MPTRACPSYCSFRLSSSGSRDSEDLRREPLAVAHRRLRRALAALVVVGEVDLSGGLVVQRHIRDVGLERLPHALADELDQRVEIELRRERLPDAVHRRQLGHALPGLVDEPSVVERDAEAAGQRRQQPLVVLGEGVRRGRRSGAR